MSTYTALDRLRARLPRAGDPCCLPRSASTPASSAQPTAPAKQVIGVSPAFLADIQPQSDGANGLKYNLTPDIIDSIFRTYPAVRQKYLQHVPHNLSETEFWTKFFQSHYFHRDRLLPSLSNTSLTSSSAKETPKDLFVQCAKEDEEHLVKILSDGIPNSLLDLNTFQEDTLALDGTHNANDDARWAKSNANNANLIRRFNQHSTMVLQAAEAGRNAHGSSTSSASAATAEANTPSPSSLPASSSSPAASSSPAPSGESAAKKRRLADKTEFEDLAADPVAGGVAMNLVKADRFLHGPTTLAAAEYASSDEILDAISAFQRAVNDYSTVSLPHVLNSSTALTALRELSPGGRLMTKPGARMGGGSTSGASLMPEEVKQDIRNHYAALNELLRHFWSCFPVQSKFYEEKVVRMKSTLENFHKMRLLPFRERLARGGGVGGVVGVGIVGSGDPTVHMEEMLLAAYKKFDTWQSRKAGGSKR